MNGISGWRDESGSNVCGRENVQTNVGIGGDLADLGQVSLEKNHVTRQKQPLGGSELSEEKTKKNDRVLGLVSHLLCSMGTFALERRSKSHRVKTCFTSSE